MFFFVFFFFFFQAEDGIRDVAVTGVQTCSSDLVDRVPVDRVGADRGERELVAVLRDRPVVERIRVDVAEARVRSEEHTSELQSRLHLVCRLLLEKKKKKKRKRNGNRRTKKRART